MPELTVEQLTLALAIVAGVALLSFLLVLVLMLRIRKVRREYRMLLGESGDQDLLATVGESVGKTRDVARQMQSVTDAQEDLASVGRLALQRFSIVRYDAFEDMGGQLSFSAALLDDYGDGIVVTSINGRTETRTYAKSVRAMKSQHNLSDEEREAIESAVSGADRGAGSAVSKARRGAGSEPGEQPDLPRRGASAGAREAPPPPAR